MFNLFINEGLYACGWCNHGAKGVLADSSNDSMLTGSTVLSDLHFLFAKKGNLSGSRQIITHFKNSGLFYCRLTNRTALNYLNFNRLSICNEHLCHKLILDVCTL